MTVNLIPAVGERGNYWIPVTKFDPRVVALYNRHYSARPLIHAASVRRQRGILSPGESLTLLTVTCDALFAWRKGIDDCIPPQTGVNCAVFRNESSILSSELVKEADYLAWQKWPGERLYTYVNVDKVRHKRDPGRCFIKAGWKVCGKSKGGLVILEILPSPGAPQG